MNLKVPTSILNYDLSRMRSNQKNLVLILMILREWLNNEVDDPVYYMLSDSEIIQETKALSSNEEPKMIDEESDQENETIKKKRDFKCDS
ncbi:unnamed protein product [Brachionus calyciflorus]|uniref:Uncharacterized protein n=1 Tax=Brachionus calyciflorus TaxID=104777 RepID=A0A813UZS8_9BILA|nr:unnamed protein product [Brachionus calyciflorus]